MKFIPTKIKGVYIIDLDKKEDERGFLARIWGQKEFAQKSIDFSILEGYITRSNKKGTIRGLHFLKIPEQKLTRVVRGAVYEVVIDIRKDSKTYGKWQGFSLKDKDYKMLFMGPGIAHAILTLEDETELLALYSPHYSSGNEGGIRYDDPKFKIPWPTKIEHISERDKNWEDFKDLKIKI